MIMSVVRALKRSDQGLALVEFAISLPVLLTLGLVGLETANYALAHLRVSNIAVMTADNAARVRDSIDEADVQELMLGSMLSGESIEFKANGRIILSSLERNAANTGQWIRWQRCDGTRNETSRYGVQGTGQNNASLQSINTGANSIAASPGTAVLVAEVTYQYQPLISEAIFGTPVIRYESAFNVRQRTNQALTNTSNLTTAQRRTCNFFQA